MAVLKSAFKTMFHLFMLNTGHITY